MGKDTAAQPVLADLCARTARELEEKGDGGICVLQELRRFYRHKESVTAVSSAHSECPLESGSSRSSSSQGTSDEDDDDDADTVVQRYFVETSIFGRGMKSRCVSLRPDAVPAFSGYAPCRVVP